MSIDVDPYCKSNRAGLLELATVIHTCARSTHHDFICNYSVSLVMLPVTLVFETRRSLRVVSGDRQVDIFILIFSILNIFVNRTARMKSH